MASEEQMRLEAQAFALEMERAAPTYANGMANYMALSSAAAFAASAGLFHPPALHPTALAHEVGWAAALFGIGFMSAIAIMFCSWFSTSGRRAAWLVLAEHSIRKGPTPRTMLFWDGYAVLGIFVFSMVYLFTFTLGLIQLVMAIGRA